MRANRGWSFLHKSGFTGAFLRRSLRPCCGNADFPISLADFRKWAGWLASEMLAVDLGNGWLALGGCFLPSEVVLYAHVAPYAWGASFARRFEPARGPFFLFSLDQYTYIALKTPSWRPGAGSSSTRGGPDPQTILRGRDASRTHTDTDAHDGRYTKSKRTLN